MRVLRTTGNYLDWNVKPVSEWDKDDKCHKNAIQWMIQDMHGFAVIRNYYLDRETLLKMYDQYMEYKPSIPIWEQEEEALYDKLRREA